MVIQPKKGVVSSGRRIVIFPVFLKDKTNFETKIRSFWGLENYIKKLLIFGLSRLILRKPN